MNWNADNTRYAEPQTEDMSDWKVMGANHSLLIVPVEGFSDENNLLENIALMDGCNFAAFVSDHIVDGETMSAKMSHQQMKEMYKTQKNMPMMAFRDISVPRTHILISNFKENEKTMDEAIKEDLVKVDQAMAEQKNLANSYDALKEMQESKDILLSALGIAKSGKSAQPEKYFLDNLTKFEDGFKKAVIDNNGQVIASKGIKFITAFVPGR